MSFSDGSAYLTPLGRQLVGNLAAAGIGSASASETAGTTADLVTSVVGPHCTGPGTAPSPTLRPVIPMSSLARTVTPSSSAR